MNRVPANLRNRVAVLFTKLPAPNGGVNRGSVFLLGTAHLSKRSKVDVSELIRAIEPSDVFVELCGNRADVLYRDGEDPTMKDFGVKDALKNLRGGGNLFAAGYAYLLHSLGKELELTPGAEFRAAYLASQEMNASMLLGDRDVRVTIFRVWQGLTYMERLKVLWQVMFQSEELLGHAEQDNEKLMTHIDSMTEGSVDLKQLFDAMDRDFPWIVESLLRERDVHMGIILKQMFRNSTKEAPKASLTMPEAAVIGDVVAVVGAAHVDGIIQEWCTERTAEEEAELLRVICSREVPPPQKEGKDDEEEKKNGNGEEVLIDDYDGVEGFTKQDLREYVSDFKRRRADISAWEKEEERKVEFVKVGRGLLFEKE